jgi:hypothetical protein
MSQFRVLIGAIVVAALVAWFATQALSASPNAQAASSSFTIALPLVIHLESGQIFQTPALPVADATDTPTPTETPANTPTTTPNAVPTNAPECDLEIEQNLQGRIPAPNTGEVTNSSAGCTYAIGLASYRMFDDNLSHQQLFSSQTALIGPGQTLTLTVELPDCAYQLDLFYGSLIEAFDPQHGQIYGDRILVTRVVRATGFCAPGTTTPTAIATPSATPAGSPTATPSEAASPTPTETAGPTPTEGGN